jgi:hypothetical protein
MADTIRRRPGRPSLDGKATSPSADVHLTLRASDYDRLDRLAKQRRESIQAFIRRLITDDRGGTF